MAPDTPDIVEQKQEIVGFQSRGAGPVGHPSGVQGKTLNSQYQVYTKAELTLGGPHIYRL